jgi:cell division protein FtsL
VRHAARALLVLVAATGVLLLFVFPARTLLDQNRQIATTETQISALTRENAQLSARTKSLADPATVEQIAHEQYGLVMPGQNAYTIIPKTSPRPATTKKIVHKAHHWWQDLEFWH